MISREEDKVFLFMQSVLWLGRRLRAERMESDVTPSGIGLLATLMRLGPMIAAQLAKEERLKAQSLSRLIVALERTGCIKRERSAKDRREILISVTEHGAALVTADMLVRRKWLENAMVPLSERQRDILDEAAEIMLSLSR